MKKFAIFGLALSLCCAMLVGCGCMNSNADVTTLPTNGETSSPTYATEAPTTQPATMPSTQPSTNATDATDATGATDESTGPVEGAMDDIMGGSTDDATGNTDAGRSRRGMIPRG